MNLEALLAELRSRLDDEAAPYLWSDESLTLYLNEAEREAAVRAKLLYDDTTPDFTHLAAIADAPTVLLDPRVLQVDRVLLDGRQLLRTTVDQLDREYGEGRWRNHKGRPHSFIEESDWLRLYPTPQADGDLRLALWRLPAEDMAAPADEPEIDARWHLQMIEWAVHLAFKRRDSDAEDARRAAAADTTFTAAFGIREDANVQRKQRIKRVPVVRPHW